MQRNMLELTVTLPTSAHQSTNRVSSQLEVYARGPILAIAYQDRRNRR